MIIDCTKTKQISALYDSESLVRLFLLNTASMLLDLVISLLPRFPPPAIPPMGRTFKEYFAAIPEWNDDTKMAALFARFPQQKEDNPATWNAKYSFWKQIIYGACKEKLLGENLFLLNSRNLASKFQRNGLVPLGIDVVLMEMEKEGLLVSLREFQSGYLQKLYDNLLRRPFKWVLSKFMTVDRQNYPQVYVLIPLFSEFVASILSEHSKKSTHHLDNLLSFGEFQSLAEKCCQTELNDTDLELLLHFMSSKSLVTVSPLNPDFPDQLKQVVIEVSQPGKASSPQIAVGIVKMKNTLEKISNQIKELDNQIMTLKSDILLQLKANDKMAAAKYLKKQKLLKQTRDQRFDASFTIETILTKIRSTHMDAEVIGVMEAANQALKLTLKESNATPEKVQDLFESIQDSLDVSEQIDSALSEGYQNAFVIDEGELEKELEALSLETTVSAKGTPDENKPTPQDAFDTPSKEILQVLKALESVPSVPTSPPPPETDKVLEQIESLTKSPLETL